MRDNPGAPVANVKRDKRPNKGISEGLWAESMVVSLGACVGGGVQECGAGVTRSIQSPEAPSSLLPVVTGARGGGSSYWGHTELSGLLSAPGKHHPGIKRDMTTDAE